MVGASTLGACVSDGSFSSASQAEKANTARAKITRITFIFPFGNQQSRH